MNIGFVHYHAFPEGGAEKVTSNLAPYLKEKGHQIFVLASKIQENLMTENDKNFINAIEINQEHLNSQNGNDVLIQKMKELEINIVVLVGDIIFSNHLEKIKNETNCKIIFAHHNAAFWEIKEIKTLLINELQQKRKNIFSRLKHLYIKIPKKLNHKKQELIQIFSKIQKNTDVLTVLCEKYKSDFIKDLKSSKKIVVMPNGILPPPINFQKTKKKQLLYIGRMSHIHKRVDRLIEIWKNIYRDFPDWEFLLVGDGEDRKNLEKQAENLDRIHFLGSTKNPSQYYDNASILCMSSQFEGIPLVLLEAQQAGVIPIAFNCSAGVESILSPSWKNGVLVENFSLKNYENSLRKLMNDENLRQKIQKNILQKSKEYDMEIIAEKWHQLFLSLKN